MSNETKKPLTRKVISELLSTAAADAVIASQKSGKASAQELEQAMTEALDLALNRLESEYSREQIVSAVYSPRGL